MIAKFAMNAWCYLILVISSEELQVKLAIRVRGYLSTGQERPPWPKTCIVIYLSSFFPPARLASRPAAIEILLQHAISRLSNKSRLHLPATIGKNTTSQRLYLPIPSCLCEG
ncbi:hypothetical protein ACLOJK_011750 [Asimina triloba]